MDFIKTAPRVLVVYYSRSGHTESVADGLARAAGGDLERLVSTRDRRGLVGYLRSGFEAVCELGGGILPPKRAPNDYDIVLIGTPTWGAGLSSPVRTYLDRFAGNLPEVGFFVTYGGRGADRVIDQMRYLTGKTPLATLALTERELKRLPSVYFGEFWERTLSTWEQRKARVDAPASALAN